MGPNWRKKTDGFQYQKETSETKSILQNISETTPSCQEGDVLSCPHSSYKKQVCRHRPFSLVSLLTHQHPVSTQRPALKVI